MSTLETCPYCDQDILETDQRSIVRGVTTHESCYRQKQAAEAGPEKEHSRPQDIDQEHICSICHQEVNASDLGQASFVAGQPRHRACVDAQKGPEEEHVRAQDKGEVSICELCNQPVEASQNAAYIGGKPFHSECRAKAAERDAIVSPRPQDVDTAHICSICNQEVNASDLGQASFVAGRPRHRACVDAQKGPEQEHVRAQDQMETPVCPLCNQPVEASQNAAFIGGVAHHSECRAKAAERDSIVSPRPQDVDTKQICSICDKEVNASDMGQASFVAGRPRHRACVDAQKGPEQEHVRAQDKGEVSICELCNQPVEASQNAAYIGGKPFHSECRAKAAERDAIISPRPQDVDTKQICSICDKEVNASDMGQASFVAGRPRHRACVDAKKGPEEEHVRAQDRPHNDNICELCNQEVNAGDLGSASYIGGKPRHRECMDKLNAKPAAAAAPTADICPLCSKEVKPGEETIFLAGAPNHRECWLRQNEQKAEAPKQTAADLCQACKKPIENRSESLMLAGNPWHRECYAEFK